MEGTIWSGRINNLSFANEYLGNLNTKFNLRNLSFLIDETHPFDVGTLLDQMGIAIRTGHHCTQPLMDFYEIPGTARVSLAFYNSKEEIDYFMESLKRVIRLLS